jgi:DUF2075 family protein
MHESGIKRLSSAAKKDDTNNGPAQAALAGSVQEAYRILLTRPIKGLYIWCEDKETNEYLSDSIDSTS